MRKLILGALLALVGLPAYAASDDGEVCAKSDDMQTAVEACSRHLTRFRLTEEGRRNTYFNRAYAYEYLAKYREAIEDYTTTISYDANDSLSYQHRAFCRARLG